MKFFFTLTLSLFLSAIAFSQSPLNSQPNEKPEIFSRTVTPQKSNRQFVSEWFNYGETISGMGGNVNYYRNYLFPDSTVQVEFTGGFGSVWKHSYGQMCDPSSPNFINNTLIDANATYTLDSILVWYRYYRFQNQNPDTVVIQVYEDNKIHFNESPWSDQRSYGNVDYNPQLRKGDAPSYEYKVLLGDADTATASQHAIVIPVGISVAAGKKVAATVTFFPGNPFTPGDTIDPVTNATVVNKINAFAIYDYKDADKIENQYFYNNGMLCTPGIRYDYDTLGWAGSYIAGNAYSSGYYYLDMAFKLTSTNVGLDDWQAAPFGVALFPSVTNENSVLQIQSNASGVAQVDLLTVTGSKVSSVKTSVQSGANKILLPVETLSAGIYFVHVEMNGVKRIMKLVKL